VRDLVTTLLDVLGLLLLALGVGAALFPLIGWAAAAASGVVVLVGAQLADRVQRAGGDGS
jgi:formate hydrogenlyase subunit 3/multisubunit Na+/H+ antiporter MnhD subunit